MLARVVRDLQNIKGKDILPGLAFLLFDAILKQICFNMENTAQAMVLARRPLIMLRFRGQGRLIP